MTLQNLLPFPTMKAVALLHFICFCVRLRLHAPIFRRVASTFTSSIRRIAPPRSR